MTFRCRAVAAIRSFQIRTSGILSTTAGLLALVFVYNKQKFQDLSISFLTIPGEGGFSIIFKVSRLLLFLDDAKAEIVEAWKRVG